MSSLAQPEDAASVLEQFTHDIANTPAEITHLMEEIQAKDLQMHAFKDEIYKREVQLQKFVRVNGGHVQNPKEDAFSKTILDCYDKLQTLQAEKLGLAQRAEIILDRQTKRLDIGLRGLALTEQFPSDWGGPSLLTSIGAALPAATTATAGALRTVSGNIGSIAGTPHCANPAQLRFAQNAAAGARSASNTVTPVVPARSQREGSSDAGNKRRRLNQPLGALPAASSHLRQSSLGPGTPKAGTPVPAGVAAAVAAGSTSRAGSAQPGTRPPNHKKGAQSVAAATPTATTGASSRPKAPPPPSNKTKSRSRPKKSSQRNRSARTPDSDADSELSASQVLAGVEDEDGDDTNLYCICQKVSFGDMVGCDNADCPDQWFHYKCVGVTEEPTGEWLCPQCRTLPKNRIKKS